jgi:hypothetical protein
MSGEWLGPSVMVAACGIVVQGAKAAWDLMQSIRSHVNSREALRLQEVSALMNLVAGLPMAEARKAAWKLQLVSLIRQKAPITDVYLTLESLMAEIAGVHPPERTEAK